MKIARYNLSVDQVPVDFFSDPEGSWEFEELVEAAGFEPDRPGVCVGALTEPFQGHAEGSAVVTEMGRSRPYVAIVDCPRIVPRLRPATRPSEVQRFSEAQRISEVQRISADARDEFTSAA